MSTKKFQTLLIEDEAPARDRLKRFLKDHEDVIEIIGEATNGEEGLQLTQSLKPDLIFLDIQMPLLTGFEMLQKLEHMPMIIFTTAYEEYAIRAFEENSVDYLLKPIRTERLQKALDKLQKMAQEPQPGTEITMLLEQLQLLKKEPEFTSITVTTGDRIIPISLDRVVYFHAEDKYVFLHDKDGKKHIIDYSLTNLEKRLPGHFSRIHRSYIINRDYVEEIRKTFNGRFQFRMQGSQKTRIESGTSYSGKIREILGL